MTSSNDPQLRVLIVDDDADTCDTMEALLQLWGHDVRTALNGDGALRLAREFEPDVVFLDIAMPGMDGYELARRLRRLDFMADTLIVCLSGFATEADRHSALESGCDLHLIKPVRPEDVRQLLANRLSHR